jgi:predicted RNA-binding protein with PUA-like domain
MAKKSAPSAKKSAKKLASRPALARPRRPGEVLHWLMKSEPDAYSIDTLARDRSTLWTGVRNYQARNFMMTEMAPGDLVLFYHSNAEPSAVVGQAKVERICLPDPSALDAKSPYFDPKASHDHPIWFCAEISFIEKFKTPQTLSELRAEPALSRMLLLQKGQRLSIMPVALSEFELILNRSGYQR